MLDSCKKSTIKQDDWGQLAADGGSNAIGSIPKFELVTQSEDGGREGSVDRGGGLLQSAHFAEGRK
jgi:hypothetical protein